MKTLAITLLTVTTLAATAVAQPSPAPPVVNTGAVDRASIRLAAADLVIELDGDRVEVSGVAGDWTKLGFMAGDVIRSVAGHTVLAPADVHRTAVEALSRDVLYIEVSRRQQPVLLRRLVSGETKTTPMLAEDAATEAILASAIKQIDATTYEVDVEALLANPMVIGKRARLLPSSKQGVRNGFKLYALPPRSAYVRLGLANGDTLHRLNKFELASVTDLADTYAKLRHADRLEVALTRRGQPVTLVYLRRKPSAPSTK